MGFECDRFFLPSFQFFGHFDATKTNWPWPSASIENRSMPAPLQTWFVGSMHCMCTSMKPCVITSQTIFNFHLQVATVDIGDSDIIYQRGDYSTEWKKLNERHLFYVATNLRGERGRSNSRSCRGILLTLRCIVGSHSRKRIWPEQKPHAGERRKEATGVRWTGWVWRRVVCEIIVLHNLMWRWSTGCWIYRLNCVCGVCVSLHQQRCWAAWFTMEM